jgi:hypothetical protein
MPCPEDFRLPVSVELSRRVDGEFFWYGRWPNALLEAINERKEDIFKKLARSLFYSQGYGAYEDFSVENQQFRVTFGASQQDMDRRVFNVDFVERL